MGAPFALATSITGLNLAAGHVVLATEWNAAVGGLYAYINNNTLLPQLNVLQNKGDLYTYDGTNFHALSVGADAQVLIADAASVAGVKWATPVNTTTLTTKGDTLGYTGAALGRLPVGGDGTVLVADSTQALGLKWGSTVGQVPIGGVILWPGSIASIPVNYQLCNGTNGTPNLQGLFIAGAGSASPAANGLGILASGAVGGNVNHSHSLSLSLGGTAGGSAFTPPVSTNNSAAIPPYVAYPWIMRIS